MSVRPVSFDPTGGVGVWDDERGHGGPVAFADVRFGRNADGSVNPDGVDITCPVCGAVSSHPIGGGCDAPRVQLLFARIWLRRAVLLGIPTGERTWAGIKLRVKARVEAMDGPRRWRLENAATEDDVPTNG